MKKIFFIDRDGTINIEKGYVHKKEDLEFIPGALESLQKLSQANRKIYIITNQAGIAKGLYSEKVFQEFNSYFLKILASSGIIIEDVLYCPHHPDGIIEAYKINCECRKPGTKLLQEALVFEKLSPSQAVMIGDRNTDITAGKKVGIESYLVLTGYGLHEKETTTADYIVKDLKEAVNKVLLT